MNTYVDDERHRDAKYIVASLRVAAAAGHLLCRACSTYLWIRHRAALLASGLPTLATPRTRPTEVGSVSALAARDAVREAAN
jgi:hypothetical protein